MFPIQLPEQARFFKKFIEQKRPGELTLRINKADLDLFQQLIFCSQISKRHLQEGSQSDIVDLNFVKTLVLYNLNLSSLKFLSRLSLSNLSHLELHFNQIASIQDLLIAQLPELKFIFLQMNKLRNLDNFHQLKWPKLKYLCLTKNKINCIQNVSKWKFLDLKKLILNENDIQSIFKPSLERNLNVITAFRSLTELSLQSNKISSIEVLEYFELDSLEELDLSNNLISQFCVFNKLRMPNIKTINIRMNYIRNVDALVRFSKEKSIKSLQISFNQFSIFHDKFIKWLTLWLDANLTKPQSTVTVKPQRYHYPFSRKIKTPQIRFDSVQIIQDSIEPMKQILFDNMMIEQWDSLIVHEEHSYC